MRILHVVDHSIPLQSGYSFRSRAIFLEQRARGWETFHLTGPKHALAADGTAPEETVDDLLFHRTAPPRGAAARLPVLNQWAVVRALERRLGELVPRIRPDILHAHSPALDGVAVVRAGRRFGIPTVYEIRGFWEDAAVSHGTSRENGLRYRLTRGLETWVLRNVDAVTCICQGIREDLVQRGIPEERISVIPNAVDPGRFHAATRRDPELESSLGLAGKPVIGFIGSFYRYEGLMLLLEAMPAILNRVPEVRLLLVGGGQDAENLQQRAAQLGLEERVLFTGRVPNDRVARYYSLIDLLCYPRLPMRLTERVTPLKPLEAMAQQKTLVASDVGGHRELIRDGETGVLFRAGDAEDLAAKASRLLQHRESWPALQSAGRAFIEEQRTWPVSVAGYEPVYRGLLPERP